MNLSINNDLFQAAIKYAQRGWPVFPCRYDKIPLTKHGFKDATTDGIQISAWFKNLDPKAIAIPTGHISKLWVLDIDGEDGKASLKALEAQYNSLPITLTQRTGSGGMHLFFAWPEDKKPIRNNVKKLGPGLDIRGDGGYVIVPPSLHSTNKRYSWVFQSNFRQIALAQAPNWLLDLINNKLNPLSITSTITVSDYIATNNYGQQEFTKILNELNEAKIGERNNHLNRIAFRLGHLISEKDLNHGYVENSLKEAALTTGLLEREVEATIKSGLKAGIENFQKNILKADDSTQFKKKQLSQSELLLQLVEQLEFFHTPDNQAFVRVPIDDHYEIYRIKTNNFKQWLHHQFYNYTKKAPGSQAIQDALNTLEAQANFKGAERQAFVRLGHHDGKIYLDLGQRNWNVVEIDAKGWRVVQNSQVAFRRPSELLPLPTPQRPDNLTILSDLINLGSRDNFILAVAWMVAALSPCGPYPVLILQGEQGSGKSFTARMLRRIFDPCQGELRTMPHNERDLMIAASNGWTIAFDNISGISTWISDALCRISTGGAFTTRTLYSDRDETLLEAKRPLLLNGITTVATRHDLVDRSIILQLPPILEKNRFTEEKIWSKFQQVHPQLLAGLLDAVSSAIRNKEKIKLDSLPRMADAVFWVVAAEEVLPWRPGGFIVAYQKNCNRAMEGSLEADQVAVELKAFMENRSEIWEGTSSELLKQLELQASDNIKRSQFWPKNPQSLSTRLIRITTFLRQSIGLDIKTGVKTTGGKRLIIINKITSGASGDLLPNFSNDQLINTKLWDGPSEIII